LASTAIILPDIDLSLVVHQENECAFFKACRSDWPRPTSVINISAWDNNEPPPQFNVLIEECVAYICSLIQFQVAEIAALVSHEMTPGMLQLQATIMQTFAESID
jgi:hypothetical protein